MTTEPALGPLPPTFAATREALRSLACYVIAPARKASTGRIGLRPIPGGFGTPFFDDGSRLVVRGVEVGREPGTAATITTLRAAAALVGLELSGDPGVGHDLPPYEPDADLAVDRDASTALGAWYAFGGLVLDRLPARVLAGTVGSAQLWPEHFDLAVTVDVASGARANVGFSPGDGFEAEPYVYVGPVGAEPTDDPYWNAPFGAFLPYADLAASSDPAGAALGFVGEGLARLPAAPANGQALR